MAETDRELKRRPDPDALLALAGEDGRGKLTIFLGAAPGVGVATPSTAPDTLSKCTVSPACASVPGILPSNHASNTLRAIGAALSAP